MLKRFGELVDERRDDLARVLSGETGKPITQARNELSGVMPRVDFFLAESEHVLATETVFVDDGAALHEQISFEPLGVVANISAWNYPWFVGVNVIVPALIAGNAVLYKPSELAIETGRSIGRTLHDAGVPPDVFIVVEGAGDVGAELLAQPIDGVFFTGSYATGKAIAEAVGGSDDPRTARAGRQGPCVRHGRCRRTGGRGGFGRRRLLQQRSELLFGRADLCARGRVRRVRRRVREDRRRIRRRRSE